MTLSIWINGTPYTYFEKASVSASVKAVSRGFSFVSTANEDNTFPVRIGDNVIVTADGTKLADGFIETLEIDYDSGSHTIRVGGRSRLADLVDSSMPSPFEVSGTSLESIIKSVLKALNIDTAVINQAGAIRSFKNDITSAEIGQNAFEFIESYSRKRQILLTTDGVTGLIIARAGVNKAPAMLKNVSGAVDNNILKATLSIDDSKRFNYYVVHGQLNPTEFLFAETPSNISNQKGIAKDKDIRNSRKIEMNAEESSDSFSSQDRAVWEKNLRIGAAYNYTATVAGNSVKGALWIPNTLVKVIDDFAQVNAELLISDVQYEYDVYSGSLTTLTMIKPEALTMEIEQKQREANRNKTSDDFFNI